MSDQRPGGERSISATDIGGIASSGDNALILAPQVRAQVANFGISYSDARDIALEVFRNNFERLAGEAYELARQRAERVTDEFLAKLRQRYPGAIENFRKPALQRALFRVQEEAACSEDSDIDDVLVDVLVERANEETNSLRRVALNEALTTVPKLTKQQLGTLSLVFYVRHVHHVGLEYDQAIDGLRTIVRAHFEPLGEVAYGSNDLRHLEYAGCLSLKTGELSAEAAFARTYFGLFCRGISSHAVGPLLRPAFQKVPGDPLLLCVPVVDDRSLAEHLAKHGLAEHTEKIKSMLIGNPKPHLEIRDLISAGNEAVRRLFAMWDESEIKHIELSSVGIAIGHANLRRVADFPAELQVWIPE